MDSTPRHHTASRLPSGLRIAPTATSILAALALGLVGCSGPSGPEGDPGPSASRSEAPSFSIGASEWSRGGRREVEDELEPAETSRTADAVRAANADSTPLEASEVAGDPAPIAQGDETPVEPVERDASAATAGAVAAATASSERTGERTGSSARQHTAPADSGQRTTAAVTVAAAGSAAPRAAQSPEEPTKTETTVVGTTPKPQHLGTRETASASKSTGPERPLATDPLEAATAILVAGARSGDPIVRANAMEGMLAWPSLLREHVAMGLVDDNRGVRFVAAMCLGEARLTDLAHLVEPLLRDRSDSVRAAAIYALRRCGRPADPSPLASMVRSDDPEVRSNAYIVLGELGDASSEAMVRDSLGRGMRRVHPIRVRIVELQAAETLVKLGSDDELEVIRAALFAPVEQGELSILACQILARIEDRSAAPMLERLVMASGSSVRPPEIRMAATQALAELGSRTQVDAAAIAVNAIEAPDPLLRAQGCAVAGAVGGSIAIEALRSRLSDPVEFVRITAAGNLLKAAAESSSVADAAGVR